MRTAALAGFLICLAAPAEAQGEFALRGQWNIASEKRPGYIGMVLIDGQRRATWDAPDDYGKPAQYLGYVRTADGSRVEIVLTDRTKVRRVNCLTESSDLLHCHIVFPGGETSVLFTLTRVGAGPASLTPQR